MALGAEAPARRPNIVLIMADDMGFSDAGCYGGEIGTPNLDRLAEGGVRFTQGYNCAKCIPSRVSLLTGLYPQQVKGNNCVTIADELKSVGYRTYAVGKWQSGGMQGGPLERGFDRAFTMSGGGCDYFKPEPNSSWIVDRKRVKGYAGEGGDFYTTDVFTDYALKFLDEHGRDSRPFFLYVPYTAPHTPLQARPDDIAKYRDKYRTGWDALRERRYERLVELKLIERRWALSPRGESMRGGKVPPWKDLGRRDKEDQSLLMATYAGMIDCMDRNIGRIMEKVRKLGKEENTLVIFLSDNGGSPQWPQAKFAHLLNTPFRKYKAYCHEGGIATPFIAHWPGGIRNAGRIDHEIIHMMDIAATCIDVAGAKYPAARRPVRNVLPLEGKSFLPILLGRRREGHDVLFWEFHQDGWPTPRGLSNRAARQGKWKIAYDHGPWELYDMEADRTELHNLADKHPQKLKELVGLWEDWARRSEIVRAKRGR